MKPYHCPNPAFALRFMVPLCLLLSSCSKQLYTNAPNNSRSDSAMLQSKFKVPMLKLFSSGYADYPAGGIAGPMMGPTIFDMHHETTLLTEHIEVLNDNQKLYISVVDANWQPTTRNLKIWIGRKAASIPLDNQMMPNTAQFPIKHTVPAGTTCFTVEIDLRELAAYLRLPSQSNTLTGCNTEFQLVVQADVLFGGKAAKAFAGETLAANGSQVFHYISGYTVFCNVMPPPPNNP